MQGLRPLAQRYGLTIYQLVLAVTPMHPGIDVAVCGIKTPGQIDEAVGAVGKTIDREDCFAVRGAVAGHPPAKVADASGTRK